jgi:hypothetical protein
MKLYTEEQVKHAMIEARISPWLKTDFLLQDYTPIELPSDDEIDKESFIVNPPKLQNDYSKDYDDDNIQYRVEWVDGANWIINKIKQQAIP